MKKMCSKYELSEMEKNDNIIPALWWAKLIREFETVCCTVFDQFAQVLLLFMEDQLVNATSCNISKLSYAVAVIQCRNVMLLMWYNDHVTLHKTDSYTAQNLLCIKTRLNGYKET